EKVMVTGLPFAPGVDELAKADLTAIASRVVRPPRVLECPRHFECKVEWTKRWAGDRLMVCGRVVAASVDADCVDKKGYLQWDRARPAHYCGAPYGAVFVKAYEVLQVEIPYDGPERARFEVHRTGMFEDIRTQFVQV